MASVTATAAHDPSTKPHHRFRTYAALARSGFRRYATYRQATVAGAVTNTVFGLLRCYVLLAVAAGAGGLAAGYDGAQLATYVWVGQGLLAVVMLWVGPIWPTGSAPARSPPICYVRSPRCRYTWPPTSAVLYLVIQGG